MPRKSAFLFSAAAAFALGALALPAQAPEKPLTIDAVHPDDRARVAAHALPGPTQGTEEVTFRIVRADGSVRWICNKSFKIVNADGDVIRHVGIAADVTEKRDLEVQLHHAQRMESLGRLAGGVAHDFNNILAIVLANTSMLTAMLPAQGETAEMLGEMTRAVHRAVGLTRQLLAFSRKQVAELIVLDVNAIVAETRKMLRRMIGEDIALKTPLLEPELPHVRMDPGHLVQILMNLAVNARDAMPGGGKLAIHTRHVAGFSVRISVSDTGTGMSAVVRARAFEPFFTTKGEGKGTGMGLAVVHGIVQQSGGRIELYMALGVGTTFHIELPATNEPIIAEVALPRACSRGTETVLVVDDDPPYILHATARALRFDGYRAIEEPRMGRPRCAFSQPTTSTCCSPT